MLQGAIKKGCIGIILIAIYLFSLSPASGGIGGLVFFFTGWGIPSVVNLLLSYAIIFDLGAKISNIPKVVKLLLFFLTSFILGINTKVFDLFSPSLIIPEVKIIQPLHYMQPDLSIENAQKFDTGGSYILKSSPFDSIGIGSDEGCGCMYFIPPASLLSYTAARTLTDLITQTNTPGVSESLHPNYIIAYGVNQFGKWELIETVITDKQGGYIVIKSAYPRKLVYLNKFNGSDRNKNLSYFYWQNAPSLLLNDNFWQWILAHYIKYPDPISVLQNVKGVFETNNALSRKGISS